MMQNFTPMGLTVAKISVTTNKHKVNDIHVKTHTSVAFVV